MHITVPKTSIDSTEDDSTSPARPALYYNDADSALDVPGEEQDSLIAKGPLTPGFAERGGRPGEPSKQQPSNLKRLFIGILSLVFLSAIIGISAAHFYTGNNSRVLGAKHITMEHVFNGTFDAERQSVHWVPEAGDGVYSISLEDRIELVDLKKNESRVLVLKQDVKDEHGAPLIWATWRLSADMSYLLLQADRKKQWRHSSWGNYYVHNLLTHKTHPIIPPTHPPITSFATFAPTGDAIAYVASNDLYILPSADPSTTPIRITTTGSATLFNGVPDWVYEEEVLSTDFSLWWSPDSSKLAYLSLDETLVDTYSFPIYNPTDNSSTVTPYTEEVVMKYPKPGYPNPLVSVHVVDVASRGVVELDWEGRMKKEDAIVTEVAWVGNDSLILKEVNRNSDHGSVVLFDLGGGAAGVQKGSKGKVVRKLGKEGEEGDDGWIEHSQNIRPLPNNTGYLDIVPSPEGFAHIALFSPPSASKPYFLTSGAWEVTSKIKAIDVSRGLVYFQAVHPRSSSERHIYSMPLPSLLKAGPKVEVKALTDDTKVGVYDASFSPQGGFYLLSYSGPKIPWQTLERVDDPHFRFMLTENTELNVTDSLFETANVVYAEIESEGFQLNTKEIRPPHMDDSGKTKYPVLFKVYGGPGSQQVELNYDRDWHHYLACSLNYIVVVVDGRGTGFKGRKLRNPVKSNLGFWETRDQINAAKIWAAKNYVDSKRIGIWGWSYGGFMSSKVVEADGGVHSLAMAVAPVTSWRLYDSIYTERYMNLPDLNPGGYVNASISNVTAFSKVNYLLMHGSGDDNVHFANSAHLLDMLTAAQVRNFRFRMFTDSDHSINRRGANREVYEYMTAFLIEKWGKGAKRREW